MRTDCEKCLNSEFYDGDKLRCKLMRCNPRYEDMEETKKWLVESFPGSFINNSYEFILGSIGFSLRGCWHQEDIDCKVLEWLSGAASKDCYILQGINKYLCVTDFSKDEMREIYSHLGNACNRQKALEFIKSNYDMNVLKRAEKENNMQKKIKEIKPGEILIFGGYEWIKLEDGLIITKDIVTDKEFNPDCNNYYMASKVEYYLIGAFMDYLYENGVDFSRFDVFPLDLNADDGTKKHEAYNVEIGLLTADLYRKNRHLLKSVDNEWWLATPKSYTPKYNDTVMYVDADGVIREELAWQRYGVRPVCKLKEDTPVDVPDEDKTSEETGKEDITDLIKKLAEEKNLTQRPYDQHIYRLIQNISDLTRHIEEEDYNEAKHDVSYIYAKLVILAKKLSGTDDEDYTSFLINEIEAGRSIW